MPMYNQCESKGAVTLDIYKVFGTNYIFVVCSERLSAERFRCHYALQELRQPLLYCIFNFTVLEMKLFVFVHFIYCDLKLYCLCYFLVLALWIISLILVLDFQY